MYNKSPACEWASKRMSGWACEKMYKWKAKRENEHMKPAVRVFIKIKKIIIR